MTTTDTDPILGHVLYAAALPNLDRSLRASVAKVNPDLVTLLDAQMKAMFALGAELAALDPAHLAALLQLKEIHDERADQLAQWRSAGGDYPALLELVIFRGVSTEDAGEQLGVSREAVAKRIRPVKQEYGLTSRGLAARNKAAELGLKRPYAKLTEEALLDKARAEIAKAAADRDANLEKADELLARMAAIINELDVHADIPDRVMAEVLGVTPMTIYRFRNKKG